MVAICFFGRIAVNGRPALIEGELIGKAESAVVADFGKADEDVAGYEPLGAELRPMSVGPHRTLIYRRLNGGTLYVWFAKRNGDWQCIDSCWFADGVRF